LLKTILLAGRKLVPFWRTDPQGWGINLKWVFTAPQTCDLNFVVQGASATPYLKGYGISLRVWRRTVGVWLVV